MRISDWSSDVCSSDLFTPAPRAFSAVGSSGHRARARVSSGSVSPAAKRSAPAQAIIAALSVHSQPGGATKRRAWSAASVSSATRTAVFAATRSEEHTSELQSLMRISYAVFCLKKKQTRQKTEAVRQIIIKHALEAKQQTGL